ncbi:DUF4333 domain-containing protein [Blastococcus sp. CCUG 61487]|uniref:DUF4333 domain-containing protein n=1 Tax=Blastococcus sp. CCUG 61487 TaxID=1840703 RepID=UPI0010BF8CA4|nr:DUF4333 domain-containing protein [Blastococcus sp. CCUG 61487]TKJ30746.1 hypothetical protein A6V29_18695 [Blastococcus sp. CCUG 61487]
MPRHLLPVLLLGAAALSACAETTLTPAEVASVAEDALQEEVGPRPDITCPDELPDEEGATTRCRLTLGGEGPGYGVTVTVIESGDDLRLEVVVDDAPLD